MQKDKNATISKLQSINQVEGFDPSVFAVAYTDLNTGETRLRLPVMGQLGWFRLVHPQGRISVEIQPGKDYFVAHARVYVDYKDPPECFLAEATASRAYDPQKPTVSPREWAQTAAIGIALRNAGFGLQMDAAGDGFDQPAVNEATGLTPAQALASMASGMTPQAPAADVPFGLAPTAAPAEYSPPPAFTQPAENSMAGMTATPLPEAAAAAPATPAPQPAYTPGQPVSSVEQAMQLPCPIKDYAGKTLGDLVLLDQSALVWIATKYEKDPIIAAGAKLICDDALQQASA